MGLGSKIVWGAGVAVALVLLFGLGLMGSYNGLVSLSQAVDAQWGQVENVVPASGRSGAEPGGDGQGRRGLREEHLHRGHRGPGQGGPGQPGRQGPGQPEALPASRKPRKAWVRRCPGCWWWWRSIPSSRPPRISVICRPSWKAPRTASRWSACASTRPPGLQHQAQQLPDHAGGRLLRRPLP